MRQDSGLHTWGGELVFRASKENLWIWRKAVTDMADNSYGYSQLCETEGMGENGPKLKRSVDRKTC